MNVFTDEEAAAILAGLRLLQTALKDKRPQTHFVHLALVDKILTDGGRLKPLTSDQIDTLCDRINLTTD